MEHDKYKQRDINGRKQKRNMYLFFAVVGVILLVALAFFLEDAGAFPGNLFNRVSVSNYLKSTYPDMEFDIEYSGYDSAAEAYTYTCRLGDGRDCIITAKRFSIKSDGYFNTYLRNTQLEARAEDHLLALLDSAWTTDAGVTAQWQCSIVIALSDFAADYSYSGDFPDEVLVKCGSSLQVTATLRGDSKSFDEYCVLAYDVVSVLQQNMLRRPSSLQVFYYRTGDVMQFESRFASTDLDMTKEGVLNAENIHFYVELSDSQVKKYKAYRIVQVVYWVVIIVTCVSLSALWIVRRIKKNKKNVKNVKNGNGEI